MLAVESTEKAFKIYKCEALYFTIRDGGTGLLTSPWPVLDRM
jgi:hypothetical protein